MIRESLSLTCVKKFLPEISSALQTGAYVVCKSTFTKK